MANIIEKLLIVQERDQRLNKLMQEAEDIPRRKQAIDARLNAQRASLEQANEDWKQKTANLKNLEVETEASRSQIRKYRDQQAQIKSNDQYKALEHEIASEATKISGIEDREITLMDEVEAARARIETIKKGMAVDQARVAADNAQMDERERALMQEINALKAERAALLAGVPADMLSRYERIFKHVKNVALVPIEHGACGGCRMNLPPQVVNDAKKVDALSICGYCGRIVYRVD